MAQTYKSYHFTVALLIVKTLKFRTVMSQTTIGQRIKFLMDTLNLKVRTLAQALEVSETNIRNYITRDSKPSSDVIERIVRQYSEVNPVWLLTGVGEPLLTKINGANESEVNYTKNNYGNSVGSNRGGTVTQHRDTTPDGSNELVMLRAMVEQLQSQLADKERLIQVLLNQSSK